MDTQPIDLEEVYETHHRLVWWAVRASGVPEPAVEDVVQDVFLSIHRRRHRAPAGDPRPWIVGVARSVSYSHRRGEARRSERSRDPLLGATADCPEAVLVAHEAWHQLREFLDGLEPEQREVLVLVDLNGSSAVEVAESLGTNLNTVYSRLRLARAKLATRFPDPAAVAELASHAAQPNARARVRVWATIAARISIPAATEVAAVATGGLALARAAAIAVVVAVGAGTAVRVAVADAEPASSREPGRSLPAVATATESRPAAPDSSRVDLPTPAAPPPSVRPTPDRGRSVERTNASPERDATVEIPSSLPTPSIAGVDPLAEESRLLRDAAKHIDRGALDLGAAALAEHGRRFPDGALARERERLDSALARLRSETPSP